jgi:hypothetical protein
MIVKDAMFGFEIKVKEFSFEPIKPKPPAGYIPYNRMKANPVSGKCPNCGKACLGTVSYGGGFQDRDVQNVSKAMDRLERRFTEDYWKPDYELFSTDLDPTKGKHETMLKCHPSRYGKEYFCCCKAEIWHDFGGDIGKWNYYYRPSAKDKNTLTAWL